VEDKLDGDKWIFVTLTTTSTTSLLKVSPYVGSTPLKILEYLPVKFQPGKISCEIAGISDDSQEPVVTSRMGAFGIFRPLTVDEITAIWDLGPRCLGLVPVRPVFFYSPEDTNRGLILQPRHENRAIEAKFTPGKLAMDESFTGTLIHFCRVESLLPLFAQLDMETVTGETFRDFLKATLDIFSQVLALSEPAQESFGIANGFGIISHLLGRSSELQITYSVYLQFFNLLSSLSHAGLQAQLVDEVLLNPAIWIRSDAENHMQIIRHWDRVLFPSILSLVADRFQYILYTMRFHYW
jgi:hypothetical protein